MRFEDIQRLQRLGPRSLDHLPPYARDAAIASILRVKELEESRLLREGIYYIVLTDLVGATASSSKLSSTQNRERIEGFVQASIFALQDVNLVNSAQFIKDVGDSALFLFAAFADVLQWHQELSSSLERLNEEYSGHSRPEPWLMQARTVIHLGEVSFSGDREPVALAVNQVFKIEKRFGRNELGCTDAVLKVVGGVVREYGRVAVAIGEVVLPGEDNPTPLWRLESAAQS